MEREEDVDLAALNYFFAGHRNKLQADLFRLDRQKDDVDNTRFRLQYQLAL